MQEDLHEQLTHGEAPHGVMDTFRPFLVAFASVAVSAAIVGGVAYFVIEDSAGQTQAIMEDLRRQIETNGVRRPAAVAPAAEVRVEFEGHGVSFIVPEGYRAAESANPEGGEATMTLLKSDDTPTLKDTRVRVTVSPESFQGLLGLRDAPPIGEPYELASGRRAVKTHYRAGELYGETSVAIDHPESGGVVLITSADGDPLAAQVIESIEFIAAN